MCISNRLLWRCRKCLGVVMVDTRYRTPCPMAVALRARCSYEATRWTDRDLRAGTDVNPRESLTEPSCGVALIRWNEFYCIHCEVVDQVLHRIELHADSSELDPWEVKQQHKAKNHDGVGEAQEQRWVGGSQQPAWPMSLRLWRMADGMDPALQGKPRWDFLVPVDYDEMKGGSSSSSSTTICRFYISTQLREPFLRGDNDSRSGGSKTDSVEGDDDDDGDEGGAPLYP